MINYNKYVDEIRAIRDRQYEEMKNMTPEERRRYTQEKSDRVERQIAEIRAAKASGQSSESQPVSQN